MKLLSCVLLTSLFVVAKSSAGEHRFPKTDENGIPNYCYAVNTIDKPVLKHLVLDTTVAPVLAIGLTSATAVLSIFDPKGGYEMMKKGLSGIYSDIKKHYDDGSLIYTHTSASESTPATYNYNSKYSVSIGYDVGYEEAKKFCATQEALDSKKIEYSKNTNFLFVDTSKSFDLPFEKFFDKESNNSGEIAIFDTHNSVFLAKSSFSPKDGEPISSAVERIYADILQQTAAPIDRVKKEYFESQIPPIPGRPEKPLETILTKRLVESSAEFAKRVEEARIADATMREKEAEKYIQELEVRNAKIISLQEEYARALVAQEAENARILKWFSDNQEKMLESITHATASLLDFPVYISDGTASYDADNEKYHIKRFGLNYSINISRKNMQNLLKSIDSKLSNAKVEMDFKDGVATIKKISVKAPDSDWFEVIEDGEIPKVRIVEAVIVAKPPKIKADISVLEGELTVIPQKTGVWDSSAAMKVADLYNPKAPEWFSTPNSKEKIAYGTGLSLDEAKNDALRELAIMYSANISVKQSTKTKVKGTPSAEVTSEKEVNVSTNKSYTGSYRIIKQESMDGRWYASIQAQK